MILANDESCSLFCNVVWAIYSSAPVVDSAVKQRADSIQWLYETLEEILKIRDEIIDLLKCDKFNIPRAYGLEQPSTCP